MSTYDIIVIGAGHNGLVAATTLAKAGKKVVVVEKRNIIGGIAAGEEFISGYFNTGLVHDTSGVRLAPIKHLELEKHGLKLQNKRMDTTILSKDGQHITLKDNVSESVESIAKISKKDAQTYIDYRLFLKKVSRVIDDLMDNPPPNIDLENLTMASLVVLAKKAMILKGLGNKTMMELLKVAPMSVRDFLNEKFETSFLKAGIAAPALYNSYAGPWSAYSTINLLLWECAAKHSIVGGPSALIQALSKAALANGVEIRTNTEVEKIQLDKDSKVRGVRLKGGEKVNAKLVLASCTPKETFLNLFDDFDLEYELDYWISKIRSRGTTAKLNIAVNKEVLLNNQPLAFARTGNTFNEQERAFDPIKYEQVTDSPFLDIHLPTIMDTSLAPSGHSVLSVLAHYVPYNLKEGWTNEAKAMLGRHVINELEYYSPNLSKHIVGMEVLSPVDLEERYGLTEGHIYHGEHFVDQLITRPIPSCSRYATPVSGLYLCGSGSHPGGGITCMPGYLGAKRALKEF